MMDFKAKVERIKRLLHLEEYTPAAIECVKLIEQVLRQVLIQSLSQLEEKERLKIREAEQEKGGKEKGLEKFTMGELIGVILKSKFFDAWTRISAKDLSRIRLLNLDELKNLRNALIHNSREASQSEANFLFHCVQVFLGDFGIMEYADLFSDQQEPSQEKHLVPLETGTSRAAALILSAKNEVDGQDEPLIFVSYVLADDQHVSKETIGWVSILIKKLSEQLTLKLDRKISIDYPLHKDFRVAPEILNTIEHTPILLIFLSPNYLASEWCQRPQNNFLPIVQERIHEDSYVFIIECNQVKYEIRPPEFDELIGHDYPFWVSDNKETSPRTLMPEIHEDMHRYNNLLTRLSCDLADILQQHRQKRHVASTNTKISPTTESCPTVFLAGVTDDLEYKREEIKSSLSEANIQVIPEICYFMEPAVFEKMVSDDLAKSDLFVQLLGAFPGKKPPGLPQGYVRRQYELAQEVGKLIMQWHAPELNIEHVYDADWRNFLILDTVCTHDFEEFISEIIRKIFPPGFPQETQAATGTNPGLVFIDADTDDLNLAYDIGQKLTTSGLECVLPFHSPRASETREAFEQYVMNCDALMIVYGGVTPKWVNDQFLAVRKLEWQRKQPFSAYAIYDGPPEQKAPISIMSPRINILQCRSRIDEEKLNNFAQSIYPG